MTEGSPHQNRLGSLNNREGIPLVLDPNLIRLSSKVYPNTNYNNDTVDNVKDTTAHIDEPSTVINQNLVNNPYEIFGKLPLQQLIPLILHQCGPGSKFSDLSEEQLLEQIQSKEGNGNVDHDKLDVNTNHDMETQDSINISEPSVISTQGVISSDDNESNLTQETFLQMRKEFLDHINFALNESSLALEFISLLLTSVKTSAGASSMSPFLKKNVPSGSLNADKIQLNRKSSREKLINNIINKAWKLRTLEESKNLLKENYIEIQKSLQKEHEYWSKISDSITNKDVVFKMRDNETGKRSLGVKYGYEDSGSLFKKDKGIAILRHNSELNKLVLVPLSNAQNDIHINKINEERFLRIRILTRIEEDNDFIVSGESSLDELFLNKSDRPNKDDIRIQIKKLQFFIFEHELMYQLKKESIHLIPYGVTIENENKIVIEFANEKIEIETISLEDDTVINQQQSSPRINDRRACLFLTMLRMLLVIVFKKQLIKTLKPHPNKSKYLKGYDKDLLILRPMVGNIRHQKYLNLLKKIVNDCVLSVITGSTIKLNPAPIIPYHTKSNMLCDRHIEKLEKEIFLFNKVLNMPESSLIVFLPSKGNIELCLKSTNHCNAIVNVKYIEISGNILFNTELSEFKELEEFLHFIVSEYIL